MFYQSKSQQQLSIFFSPPDRPLEHWRESYIPVLGVSIGWKEWVLNVKVNPSWLFLGFTLLSPRLRVFPKPSLSWQNHRKRQEWRLYSLIPVFNLFSASLMWMVWVTCYCTPQHESTAQQWFNSGYRFFSVKVVFLLASSSWCMLR